MSFKKGKFRQAVVLFLKEKKKRVLIWLLAAVVCISCSVLTYYLAVNDLGGYSSRVFPYADRYNPQPSIPGTVELQPGESVEQSFTAMGNIVGACSELFLKVPKLGEGTQLCVELWSDEKQEVVARVETEVSELQEGGIISVPFPDPVLIRSAEKYRLTVMNTSPEAALLLEADHSIQSGTLSIGGERVNGALVYGFWRTSLYTPSALTVCMILLTNITVLAGLALVLFGNVKEHVLYLVLAIGFGFVMLFDLTALYGFDMRFQFDSAYVVSNELLGLEGELKLPSMAKPEQLVSHYYRRACDDYAMFQFYDTESVSDNYVDMRAAAHHLKASTEEQELILVEANQGILSDQRYILYLPQAIGFTAARLLGLGFLPMVQCGRLAAYGVFVLLMFFAIRSVPFGKRLFLILALLPAVMTEAVSINRDCMIFGLSFFVIARVLQAAYADREPTIRDWAVIWAASALLAPCKAVYLPISFFWILAVCRRYLSRQGKNWRRATACAVCGMIPIVLAMVLASSISVFGMLSKVFKSMAAAAAPLKVMAAEPTAAAVQTTAPALFTFQYVVNHFSRACVLLWNTLRLELGFYLVNAIQLFDIGLGSSDLVTVLILFLLLLECFTDSDRRRVLGAGGRWFCVLVPVGVFLTTALAAFQWTPVTDLTILGIQGRYLIPVLPLLGVSLMNGRIVKIQGNPGLLVKACCCIFPAIYLMNMYLWTVAR